MRKLHRKIFTGMVAKHMKENAGSNDILAKSQLGMCSGVFETADQSLLMQQWMKLGQRK